MKRTVIGFVLAVMVLITIGLWLVNSRLSGGMTEILSGSVVVIVVGFAIYLFIGRAKSLARKEPLEDELSKKVMMQAASLSYYISIYFWLFLMFISDKVELESHTLIGAGILGMAVIFFLSWVGIKVFGLKNG